MLLCGISDVDDTPRAWQAAQHIVEHYRPQWEQLQPNVSWRPAPSQPPQAQAPHVERRRRVWRVLFQTRGTAVRRFVNLEGLLRSCSAWSYLDDATQTLHTAQCGVWPSLPLLDGIAGVRVCLQLPRAAHRRAVLWAVRGRVRHTRAPPPLPSPQPPKPLTSWWPRTEPTSPTPYT